MTDAHNHLQDSRFDAIRDQLLADMSDAGVTRCVVNGTCPEDWPKVAALAAEHPGLVIPSFGLHPWKKPSADWQGQLIHFLDHTPASGIGECGLDRWIEGHDIDSQKDIFTAHLKIASERNLPLSIHCLKAWGVLLDVLESNPLPDRGFLIHSYGGSAELVPRLARLGAYFSLSGYFLRPGKSKVLDAYRSVPADKLLLETDAPDMLPPDNIITHPLADGLNHPANLVAIAKTASETIDISLVNRNFSRFFGK